MDLLLNKLGLERERLWVTIFGGDATLGIGPDEVAIEEWRRLGFPSERIVPLGVDNNLWTMGGPCGPCTKVYVDLGESLGCGEATCRPGCDCGRFLEVANLVFMEYEQHADGTLIPLPQRNVDVGMGLERLAVALQDVTSAFEIDLFAPASKKLQELAPGGVVGNELAEVRARRMILDHTRAALFAGWGGVQPGREGRSSVVRRLIRRAARQGRVLGIKGPFLRELVVPLVQGHAGLLTAEEHTRIQDIMDMLTDEERRFARVLTVGLRLLSQMEPDERGMVAGERLFELHAEKGFSSDLAAEVLAERGLMVDWSGYERALQAHREVSRVGYERHLSS